MIQPPNVPAESTPAKRPFYKRWWVWVAAAVVVIIGIAAAAGSGDTGTAGEAGSVPATTATATTPTTSSTATSKPGKTATSKPAATATSKPATSAAKPGATTASELPETAETTTQSAVSTPHTPSPATSAEASETKPAGDPEAADRAQIAEQFGTFDTFEQSGTGDSTIKLPAGAKAGMVTASHKGSANFAITALDKDNEPTGDLLVNTIGAYSGVTAYGLSAFGDATKLAVEADGAWKVTIAPLAKAPTLDLPAKQTGDQVFLYLGPAADWSITHKGDSNFAVVQYSSFPNLMVNEIGDYSGVVPAKTGPTVVTVGADGSWTITDKS